MYIALGIIVAVVLLVVIGAARDKAKPKTRNSIYLTGYGPEYRKQGGEEYGTNPRTTGHCVGMCTASRDNALTGGLDAYRSQYDRERQEYFQEMASGKGSQGGNHWEAPDEHPEYDSPVEFPAPVEAPIPWEVFVNSHNSRGK